MTAWGVALLVAAVVGGTVAARRAVREAAADPSEGSVQLRRVRLAETGTTAGLVALVAVLSGGLTAGAVIGLLSLAVGAGRAAHTALLCMVLMPERGGLVAAYLALAGSCAVAIPILGLVGHGSTGGDAVAAHRSDLAVLGQDSIRFGVLVQRHERPPVLTVSHRPTLADADYGGGIAVPVQRYAVDGSTLVLQVEHHSACYVGVVVIGPIGDGAIVDTDGLLDVIVLYGRVFRQPPTTSVAPSPQATSSDGTTPDRTSPDGTTRDGPTPSGASPSGCRPTGDPRLTDHSAVEIALPPRLRLGTVRDAGADGAAEQVR